MAVVVEILNSETENKPIKLLVFRDMNKDTMYRISWHKFDLLLSLAISAPQEI